MHCNLAESKKSTEAKTVKIFIVIEVQQTPKDPRELNVHHDEISLVEMPLTSPRIQIISSDKFFSKQCCM